jgi:hypothetical protein
VRTPRHVADRSTRSIADLTRPRAIAIWLGFALAALFFYPLASSLADNPFYLQWQPRDLRETAVAAVVLAVVFGAAIHYTWAPVTPRSNAALALVAAFPIASLLAGVLQQLPFDTTLIRAWDHPALRFGLPLGLAAAMVVLFARWPAVCGAWLRRGLLAVSFVAPVAARVLVVSAWGAPVTRTVERATPAGNGAVCRSILALLFDELSFPYVYDDTTAIHPEFAALRRFASSATQYLRTTAPGGETLISMPGYLAARTLHDVRVEGDDFMELDTENHPKPFVARAADGLFATARRAGLRTEMIGYYLPYCEWLGDLVDKCESYSFYNAAGLSAAFSPWHPIETTLILWPRQFPFGLVKNPPFARFQRDLVARTLAFAERPIDPGTPTFRFVHFSVPHLPFVFDEHGFNPPSDPLRSKPDDFYRRQLRYVDRLLDTVVSHMQNDGSFDRTTLVVLSDHGFRFGGRDRDPRHIPFIVKEAGQATARQDEEPRQAAELLRDLVAGSCK